MVAGRQTLEEAIIEAPGGFGLIPGASGLAQMAALGEFERMRLIQQVRQLEEDYDLGVDRHRCGGESQRIEFCPGCGSAACGDDARTHGRHGRIRSDQDLYPATGDCDVRVLVNMVKDTDEARSVFKRIDAVCRRFLNLSTLYAGHVVSDPRVSVAVRRRRPFILDSPNCDASGCINQLAHRMDRHAIEPRGDGLLRRMAMWLAG